MRLEPLCRISMKYSFGSWQMPYPPPGDVGEGLGFGNGEGIVSGEVEGTIAWANYPRRRQDGVWTPNLRGVITTSDGHEVLVSIHGQSVQELETVAREPGTASRRAILARIELTTEAEPLRWLNTCFMVGEGEIEESADEWWIQAYVCVNEVAQGRPAIGAEPPERFRQVDAG